jgi:hypothetical protein
MAMTANAQFSNANAHCLVENWPDCGWFSSKIGCCHCLNLGILGRKFLPCL